VTNYKRLCRTTGLRSGKRRKPIRDGSEAGAIRVAYDIGLLPERKPKELAGALHLESRDIQVDDITVYFDSSDGWIYKGSNLRIEEIRVGRQVVKMLAELGNKQTTACIVEHLDITRQTEAVGDWQRSNAMILQSGRPSHQKALANHATYARPC